MSSRYLVRGIVSAFLDYDRSLWTQLFAERRATARRNRHRTLPLFEDEGLRKAGLSAGRISGRPAIFAGGTGGEPRVPRRNLTQGNQGEPMRQIWIVKSGRPEALVVKEAPDPQPKGNEVRIHVELIGVNFADIMGRMGIYPDLPPLPVVVGYEVAGRVDVVGTSADPVWLGRDVFALTRFGGYSDVICVPDKQVFARPVDMSADEGAAFPLNYLTAWQLVVVMGGLKRGETVLIHSAGGGVGIAATQIALHIGAKVIGVASASKHDKLKALGVEHLIDQRREDFEARTREITAGRGVELVLDAVGGDSLKKGYRLLAPTGRLGMFGLSSAANAKERDLLNMFKTLANMPWFNFTPTALINSNKGAFGVNLGHMWGEVDRMRGWMDELLDLRSRGIVRPKIDRTFRFDEAPLAHHYIQDRKNVGKVLLKPGI